MKRHSRVTIKDVAERAGVSVATVSKVINNRYGVAEETYARVQAVIDELGYETSLVAQSLRSHQTNVIGILVVDLEPFSTELLKGAAKGMHDTGFELVVYSASGLGQDINGWERRYLSRISGTLTDGVQQVPFEGTGVLDGTIESGDNPSVNITATNGTCTNQSANFTGTYDSANERINLQGPVDFFDDDCSVILTFPMNFVLDR